MLKIVLHFVVLCGVCCGYKILVAFSFPSLSHCILGEGYVRHLLKAGHHVTYITPRVTEPIMNKIQSWTLLKKKDNINVEYFNFGSSNTSSQSSKNFKFSNFLDKQQNLRSSRASILFTPANRTIFHESVQNLIRDPKEQFDIVVAEWMFVELVGCGLAAVFNCPLIWSTSMETINPYLTLIQSTMNPAFITTIPLEDDPPFSFWRRLVELYRFCYYYFGLWVNKDYQEDLFKKAFGPAVAQRGRVLPSFQEARYNASLVLGNSWVSTGIAMTLPQNYKQIGGYHLNKTVAPLSKDLQKIMDESQHGVIYFSLGSILQTEDTPVELTTGLMEVFAGLKQTVLWKFEANFSAVPPNVHLMKWTPQQSILAHKNCVLFITHGGLLSLTETVHYGVPVVGIPLFADQVINVNRAVRKGFGKTVTLSMDLAKDLKVAIEDVIGNHSYMEKAKEYSRIHRNRLVPPGAELVFWIEHVIETSGAPHLRPITTAVPYYQMIFLDVLLLIVLTCYGMMKGVRCLFGYVNTVRKLKDD